MTWASWFVPLIVTSNKNSDIFTNFLSNIKSFDVIQSVVRGVDMFACANHVVLSGSDERM